MKEIKVHLTKKTTEVLQKIEVDGKEYPLHDWNIEVIEEYEKTGDHDVLERLKDFALDI